MGEVAFAKSLLATLDRRPVKLSSDFVSDPRKYPSQTPYILTKPGTPFPTPSTTTSSKETIALVLKPTKPSLPTLDLTNLDPAQTTILDLKTSYAASAGVLQTAVKILWNKRPVGDLKTLRDVLPTPLPTADIEFGVMVLGAAGAAPAAENTPPPPPVQQAAQAAVPAQPAVPEVAAPAVSASTPAGPAVADVLRSDAFWDDLKGFLVQRLGDQNEGERLTGVFKLAV